jgi:hypothetical protein
MIILIVRYLIIAGARTGEGSLRTPGSTTGPRTSRRRACG